MHFFFCLSRVSQPPFFFKSSALEAKVAFVFVDVGDDAEFDAGGVEEWVVVDPDEIDAERRNGSAAWRDGRDEDVKPGSRKSSRLKFLPKEFE